MTNSTDSTKKTTKIKLKNSTQLYGMYGYYPLVSTDSKSIDVWMTIVTYHW